MSNSNIPVKSNQEQLAVKEKLTLVLEEQQKKIQDALAIAEMSIDRTYLPECIHYNAVPLNENTNNTDFLSKSRLFKLKRFVYNPDDSVMEKMKVVFLALSQLQHDPSVFLVIHNEAAKKVFDSTKGCEKIMPGTLSLYFGIRTDSGSSEIIGNMFQECFINTFPGSELDAAPDDYKLLENNEIENIVCVSALPSVKKDADGKAADIGLEQFVDSMRNHNYTAFLIAAPVSPEVIQARKRELENMYTQLSVHRKQTLAYGENESLSVSEGINKSFSKSQSLGKSFTQTQGYSTSVSTSKSSSNTTGNSYSSSMNGQGGGSSSGSSSSHTSSESFSRSETRNFSTSEGTSTTDTTSETNGTSTTEGRTSGNSKTLTIECENKNVVSMLEKIDAALQRINDAETYGLWECAAYFTSKNTTDAVLAANSYKALILGDQSSETLSYITTWKTPSSQEQTALIAHETRNNHTTHDIAIQRVNDLVNVRKTYINSLYPYILYGMHPVLHRPDGRFEQFRSISPTNAVSGKDLPRFFSIPLKSLPGIVVDSIASFERSVFTKKLDKKTNSQKQPATIPLGCVFHMGNKDENTRVSLNIDSLTSHCFISGSTGSGKSNTMSKILEGLIALEHDQNHNRKINFLVIEPAKGEYKKDFHNVKDIKIFTTNPHSEQLLHLNPFRFPEEIHVLEHIDRLLNIFGSCWELTAAMPAILKKSVEQAYEAAGWDLCSSFYVGSGKLKYPTFASLVIELRNVINSSDYSAEAKGNYTGALVTRVESLAAGILKKIFCSDEDISYEDLFDSRVVVDLSRLGSPETKSMIMGVLVMLLSEYRMAGAQKKNETNKCLHHVTIIEEAHNLLKNAAAMPGGSELISKSIEMISNAIAEMRTYGEGFIIVDQSPTAVDISAIKNTNTKIVMRLPEQSDCEAMANAMGLNENQQKEIAKLLPGKAIVMQNDWVASVMVAIDEAEGLYVGKPDLISADGNRHTRAIMASAFAELAERQIKREPEFDAITWWGSVYRLLRKQVEHFEKDNSRGIGHAKAAELFKMCEYYRNSLQLTRLEKAADITYGYGKLIVSLLECENCWKIFLQKEEKKYTQTLWRIQKFFGSATDKNAHFTELLSRYVPIKNAPWKMLHDCIIAYFLKDGIELSGGTLEEANVFRSVMIPKKAVSGDKKDE